MVSHFWYFSECNFQNSRDKACVSLTDSQRKVVTIIPSKLNERDLLPSVSIKTASKARSLICCNILLFRNGTKMKVSVLIDIKLSLNKMNKSLNDKWWVDELAMRGLITLYHSYSLEFMWMQYWDSLPFLLHELGEKQFCCIN